MARKVQKEGINKQRINKRARKFLNANVIKAAFLLVLLILILWKSRDLITKEDILDSGVIISFLFLFVCEILAEVLARHVKRRTEDAAKLTENYEGLVKRYCVDIPNMVHIPGDEVEKIPIPVICDVSRKISDSPFVFSLVMDEDASGNPMKYDLPTQIAQHSQEIMEAHSSSDVFDNINLRLNKLEAMMGHIELHYGYTTYYDSLLTNRAMDFEFGENRTIRETYEPGPMINSPEQSKLSNHIGFNGFVELSDGKIIFLQRDGDLSIAKRMWSQSVGAALKTKYCLNKDHVFTEEGLGKAIAQEIKNELFLPEQKDVDYVSTIFAFYRDLVEGGKPQFLFYLKEPNMDSKAFEENFRSRLKENKEKVKKAKLIDGTEFRYYTVEELRNAEYGMNYMKIGKDEMRMMPSSIASIMMLLDNID